jgi:hypothetical protein
MSYLTSQNSVRASSWGYISLSDAPGIIALVSLLAAWLWLSAGDLHNGFLALGMACITGGIEGTLRIHYGALVIWGPVGIVLMILGAYV